jgi:PAS domain S-box-containing protein
MDGHQFKHQIDVAQARSQSLLERINQPDADPRELVREATETLSNSLEELHVAYEELQQQNEELLAVRRQLADERQRYQELFAFAPDGYLVTDAEGVIQEANRPASAMFRVEPSFLLGKALAVFVAGGVGQSDLYTLINGLRAGNPAPREPWETRLRPRDGDPFPAAVTVAAVRDADGELTGMRWLLRDITERKLLERQLETYTRDLERTVSEKVRELEQERNRTLQLDKLASLGRIATGVGHELNQPLTAMRLEADFLKLVGEEARDEHDGDLNAALDAKVLLEVAQTFEGELARCYDIVNHLRDFGRLSEEPPSSVSLNRPIEDSLVLVKAWLRNRGVDLHLDLAEDLPPIMAHPHRLEQVFLNLINNAQDALDERQAREPGHRKVLEITTRNGDGEVIAHVRDNGPGIPRDVQEHLFEPFFTTKPRGEGTGLGLFISRSIVTSYDGHIAYESVEGEGTTFTLRFPAGSS